MSYRYRMYFTIILLFAVGRLAMEVPFHVAKLIAIFAVWPLIGFAIARWFRAQRFVAHVKNGTNHSECCGMDGAEPPFVDCPSRIETKNFFVTCQKRQGHDGAHYTTETQWNDPS